MSIYVDSYTCEYLCGCLDMCKVTITLFFLTVIICDLHMCFIDIFITKLTDQIREMIHRGYKKVFITNYHLHLYSVQGYVPCARNVNV